MAGILASVGVLVLRGVDLRALASRGMAALQSAGPSVYFSAMAVLPAMGAPIMAFLIPAGPIFGVRLGMGMVVTLSLGAQTVNLVLTYLLSRYVLCGLLKKLLTRYGYRLPSVEQGDATDLTIIVRATPGTPFFVQNYLLGLAGVPFWKYLTISCVFNWSYSIAFVLFGEALLHGNGKTVILAVSLLIVAMTVTHLARKHYASKRQLRE